MFRFFTKKWSMKPISRIKDEKGNTEEGIVEEEKIIVKKEDFEKEIKKIDELYSAIKLFEGCAFKQTAKNTVIFSGEFKSPLMIIGEAPGADEDAQGIPFVGDSGKLLNKMLEAVEIDRKKTYITNVVYWRPPGNRKPTEEEIETLLPFLEKHIELHKPRFILALGASANYALTKNKTISLSRGKIQTYKGIPMISTFHPSYILRMPKQKLVVWKDLQLLKEELVKIGLFEEISL